MKFTITLDAVAVDLAQNYGKTLDEIDEAGAIRRAVESEFGVDMFGGDVKVRAHDSLAEQASRLPGQPGGTIK